MINFAQLRKFPIGCIILISGVIKDVNCEANYNQQPDECTMSAARKYGRSAMWLVHSARYRPALRLAGNTPLQLLGRSSAKGSGPSVTSAKSIHVCG